MMSASHQSASAATVVLVAVLVWQTVPESGHLTGQAELVGRGMPLADSSRCSNSITGIANGRAMPLASENTSFLDVFRTSMTVSAG